jgi:hypothetical protein
MTRPNVVLIVIDTLRLDHSSALDELLGLGLERYDNVISPASWTLPAHVSLMTGQMPSKHGVHASAQLHTTLGFLRVAREAVGGRQNILSSLHDLGYVTYGFCANPMISPESGFQFDQYYAFDYAGEVSRTMSLVNFRDAVDGAKILLRKRAARAMVALAYRRSLESVWKLLGSQHKEKGSKSILKRLDSLTPSAPYFFFVNLMEAHEPYRWGENPGGILVSSVLGRPTRVDYWKQDYAGHAELSISRAIEIVKLLVGRDALVILTSDHGQLLGEKGRYGHGFFLDEVLLRVPLYIRLPKGAKPLSSGGPFIGLAEIPKIIEAVVNGEGAQIGSEVAFSESFGCQNSIDPSLLEDDEALLSKIYARRTRCFSRCGSFVYNHDSKEVEESVGSFPAGEISRLVSLIPAAEAEASAARLEGLSSDEERQTTRRLKDLGYE